MKIAFIGAGSTIFMRNIIGDVLQFPALADASLALMDIDASRLDESRTMVQSMIDKTGAGMTLECFTDQRAALEGADFVIVAFQIGGYDPCTITDFRVPKAFGLDQTIGDTLGIGGIMRGLRTVPHLWSVCEDILDVCPDAWMLQYVNPMAINCWAIAKKYPQIKQIGLCHSVENTLADIAHDLDIDMADIRHATAGINHMSFFSKLEHVAKDGTVTDLYPVLKEGYQNGTIPKTNRERAHCPNKVRYEMMMRLGFMVTESSEHFAEYVPWFIKSGRPDLIEKFGIPLDEYPNRCVIQMAEWKEHAETLKDADIPDLSQSHEYAATIMNSIVTGAPSVIYANVTNHGYIPQLPDQSLVEVPCLVDANGVHPTVVKDIPVQLIALMRTQINVQELTVAALTEERKDHIYHAAMLDPHTGAELDLDQIYAMVDKLIEDHGSWLPDWCHA